MVKLPESSSPQDFDLHGAQRVREMMELNPFLGITGCLTDMRRILAENFAFTPSPPIQFITKDVLSSEEYISLKEKLQRDPDCLEKVPGYPEIRTEIERARILLTHIWNEHITTLLEDFECKIDVALFLWDSFHQAYQFRLQYPDDKKPLTVTQLMNISKEGVLGCIRRLGLHLHSFANVDSLLTLIERSPRLSEMRKEIQDFLQEEEQG